MSSGAPLSPSAEHARELLQRELAKSEYQSSKPGLLDRAAQAVLDWLSSLKFGSVHGTPAIALAVLLVIVAAALVVAFFIYGLPRLRRRASPEAMLFGDVDARTADALRLSADRAAGEGDFVTAIVERFRAIARDLDERGELTTTPGTTAHAFGERAAELFPSHASGLRSAAATFDEVRYLDRPGTEAAYGRVRELDLAVARVSATRAPAEALA